MKKLFGLGLFLSLFFLVSLFFPKISSAQNCTASSWGESCYCQCPSGSSVDPNNDCLGSFTGSCSPSTCVCIPHPTPLPTGEIDFGTLENVAAPNFANRTLGYVVNSAIIYLFPIAGFLLLLYLIYGGYQYLLSGGDPKSVDAGKKNITNAVAGFIIIFLAYWVVQIIGRILGIEAIGDIFSP